MPPDLLQFSDRQVPRYTSYPTAVQFVDEVGGSTYAEWLAALPAKVPLSIYLHVPFCTELCLYCGCHTTVVHKYTPVAAYADLLEREISLVGRHLGERRRVVHMHWGGGTPTMLRPRDFARLSAALRRTFSVASDCEIAIEIDPRTLTHEAVLALKEGGVTRASVGVQDFEPRVQKAVGRVQSFEQTARAVDWLRDVGIVNINLDLMYGLPYQTAEISRRDRAALARAPTQSHCFVRLCPRPVDEAASEVAAGSGVTWRERALRAESGRGGRTEASRISADWT